MSYSLRTTGIDMVACGGASHALTGRPYGDHESREDLLIAFGGNNTSGPIDVATACNARGGTGRLDFESETFVMAAPEGFSVKYAGKRLGGMTGKARDVSICLDAKVNPDCDQGGMAIVRGWGVRRLTPKETERLMGLPDDWTLVPYRGKPMADGKRYRMVGNSMAVNCMRWIGHRIDTVADRQRP